MTSGRWCRPSEWLAYATVALAPLPFGSVETVWICVWCLASALSLASADLGRARAAQVVWLVPVLVAFGAIVAVVWVQQQPRFPGFSTGRFWAMGAGVDPAIVPRNAATLDPTWRALGPSLLFTLVFVRWFLLAAAREQAERLLWIVAVSAALYAVFGIASAIVDPGMLLWRTKRAYVDDVTGTFVNRNTAATYFGSAATIWWLLILREVRRSFGSSPSYVALGREIFVSGFTRRLIRDLLGFGLAFAATLVTGSRAGSFITVVAVLAAAALWAGRMPIRRWLLAGCAIAILIGGFVQIWGGTLANRFEARGFYDLNRAETYAAVIGMIRDFPWFGIGLGQFEIVFPAYRGNAAAAAGVWDKAHSVPLELAAEVGLPAAVIVGMAWTVVGAGMIRGLRRVSSGRIFPIAGLAVGLLGTGHSLVDFSLQIPGYAVTFAAITAAGLAQSVRRTKRDSDEADRLKSGRAAAILPLDGPERQ